MSTFSVLSELPTHFNMNDIVDKFQKPFWQFGIFEEIAKFLCKKLVCEFGSEDEALIGNCSLYWQEDSEDSGSIFVDISLASKIILGLLYTIIFIVSLVGNTTVIAMFCCKKGVVSHITNMLILNLAVSDLLITFFCIPFNLALIIQRTWDFGSISHVTCKLVPYMQTLAVVSSILTLACIAAERYVAIILPLKAKTMHTMCRTVVLVIYVWFVAVCFAIPNALWYNLYTLEDLDSNEDFQGLLTSTYSTRRQDSCPGEEQQPESSTDIPCPWDPEELPSTKVCMLTNDNLQKMIVYEWMFFAVLFLFPLITMVFTYSEIGYRLWVRRSIGNRSVTYDQMRLRTSKKVVMMLLVVLLLFIICWAPLQVFILIAVSTSMPTTPTTLNLKYYLQWLALSNSAYNPVVYTFMHEKFRKSLDTSCCGKKKVHPTESTKEGTKPSAQNDKDSNDNQRTSSNGTANTNISPVPTKY